MPLDTPTLARQLAAVPAFAGLSADDLAWLAVRMEVRRFNPGDIINVEDTPADRMVVILEGEIDGRRDRDHFVHNHFGKV